MDIHFLKTVWSDIIILQEGQHFAMIDTGMADQFPQIKAFLDRHGASSLDFILLTHFHRDHYGSVPALLDTYPVGKVILKEYSGLDCRTAWGTEADDAYRTGEMEKYCALQALAREKSELLQAEQLNELFFCGVRLQLFNTANSIRAIFNDPAYPETYHQYAFSENQNSLAIYMEAEGVSVFLGGDIQDAPSAQPLANYMNTRIAAEIGKHVDIYKAPHHGTPHTGTPDAIKVYRPDLVIVTNGLEYLHQYSDLLEIIGTNAPQAQIVLTEDADVTVSLKDHRFTCQIHKNQAS